jgi:Sarcoglycan alpha/epsilon
MGFSGVKSRDQYEYRPSQINSPDLPPWINYVYSPRHQLGFLYGVPPPMPQPTGLEVKPKTNSFLQILLQKSLFSLKLSL